MFPFGVKSPSVERSTLVWEISPGHYLPAENTDPKNAHGAGVLGEDGQLRNGGNVVYLQFTVAGGDPSIGQTVYMAQYQDDSNTGSGMATATEPDPDATITFPGAGTQIGNQQVVPVGVCIGEEDVPGSRYFMVRLSSTPFTPIPSIAEPDSSDTFYGVKFPGAGYPIGGPYWTTDGTPAQMKIADGETLLWKFIVENLLPTDPAGGLSGFYNWSSATAKGFEWFMAPRMTAGQFYNISQNTGASISKLTPGLNSAAVTNTGGVFRITINGLAPITLTSTNVNPIAASEFRIDFNGGALTGMVKLARVMDDDERAAVTSDWDFSSGLNPFGISDTLKEDSACQWWLDLSKDPSGTPHAYAGAAGTAFDFTVVNGPGSVTPEIKTWTINWMSDVASLIQASNKNVYDQYHCLKTDALAEIVFEVDTMAEFAFLSMYYQNWDNNNGDEGKIGLVINGVAKVATQGHLTDADTAYDNPASNLVGSDANSIWAQPLGVGPYLCRLVLADQVRWYGTGAVCTVLQRLALPASARIASENLSRKLVVIGDPITMGAKHLNIVSGAPLLGAPIVRAREGYPGTISAPTMAALIKMRDIATWGGGTYEDFARYHIDELHRDSPAVLDGYLLNMGVEDYSRGVEPVATVLTRYGLLLDALHSLDPAATITVAPLVQTTLVANGQGDTVANYNTGIASLIAARPWVTSANLSSPNTITFLVDNIHPDAAGQAALALNLLSIYGY